VSTTFQTMMAAISMGLPSMSFTFSRSLSKLRIFSEIDRFDSSGFAHRSPSALTVPSYWPKSCSTRPSFGFTTNSPVSANSPSSSVTISTSTTSPLSCPRPSAPVAFATSGVPTIVAKITASISPPAGAVYFFSRILVVSVFSRLFDVAM